MSQVLFTYIAGLFRTLRFLGMVVLVYANGVGGGAGGGEGGAGEGDGGEWFFDLKCLNVGLAWVRLMGKERLFRLVFIFIHLSLFVFHKYHPFLFTAQPLPWGGLCAAASLRSNVSGEILIYLIPPINFPNIQLWQTFQTFNQRRWTSRSLWRAWATWWGTSAPGRTKETRTLLTTSSPSEPSSFFRYHPMVFINVCKTQAKTKHA